VALRWVLAAGLVMLGLGQRLPGGALTLFTETVPATEGGTTTNQVLLTETHAFRLRLPTDWGIETVSTNLLVKLYEPGLGAGIMIRLWFERATNEVVAPDPWWRQRLEQRLATGQLVREFRCGSAIGPGVGYDFEQQVDRGTRAAFRLVFVPFPGGMAEFELRANAAQATNYYRLMRHLVGSFAAERRRPPDPP
jgi:hypothetical protein